MKILGIGTSPVVRRAAKFADAGGIVKPACSPHKQTRRGKQPVRLPSTFTLGYLAFANVLVRRVDMPTPQTTEDLKRGYEEAAQAYLRRHSGEQVGESVGEATQRKIPGESFDLVHVHRPDVQMF